MSSGRRIIIGERSVQKEPGKASYNYESSQNSDLDFPQYSRTPSHNYLMRQNKFDERMKYSELPRTPSQSNFRPRQEYFKTNIAKRKNDGVVNNLKSQLQTLKMEVGRLMNKDNQSRMSSSRIDNGFRSMIENDTSSHSREDHLSIEKYGKDTSDLISVTSENLIEGPIKRLQQQYQEEGYDHSHYLQLENNLLKTELRNLKNKYNATKQQLREKYDALEKKNEYLEISLRRSESELHECKKNLEVELQTLKFQLSRRYQQQIDEEQKKLETRVQPQRDSYVGNEHIQDKMKKLYEELSEKNKRINTINLELNETLGQVEKRKFELKKQYEKNGEIMKQLEFSKREKSRNQVLLEEEVNKRNQLQKTVDGLRQKIDELTRDLKLKDDIVSGSEQVQLKITNQLKYYKEEEQRLSEENCELSVQIRKLKQLNQSNQQQITYLKNNINEFTTQMEQLSKNLRGEKERVIEVEEYYRKLLDETKKKDEQEIQVLRKHCEKLSENVEERVFIQKGGCNQTEEIEEKKRQVNRWKSQYKLLKVKYQEITSIEQNKRQEIQTYYKSYKQYKAKNKILQMRNKILENSANQYIEKMQKIETTSLQERQDSLQHIRKLENTIEGLERQNQQLLQEFNDLSVKLQNKTDNLAEEQNYRCELEAKVMNIDPEENNGLNQVLELIKRRVEDQDDKINKYVKQIKNKQGIISKLKKQVKDLLESQETEFESFKNKEIHEAVQSIENSSFQALKELRELSKKDLELQREANQDLLKDNAEMKGRISEIESQLLTIRNEIASVTNLYNIKCAQFLELGDKYENKINQLQSKIQNINHENAMDLKQLKTEINAKQQEILSLRSETMKLYNMKINPENMSFDEALKNQIESNKKLREELGKKNEEVYRLRDSLSLLKAELDNLKSTSDIARLRFISDKKNLQVNYEVELQQMKNNMGVEQKKIQSLEQKIKLVIDQNKKKDAFIQAYIMGKKLPTSEKEFVTAFLKEYEITVTGKRINEKLQNESQQLEKLAKYNFNLMKQIAEMKEKLILYETDNQNEDIGDFQRQHMVGSRLSSNGFQYDESQ